MKHMSRQEAQNHVGDYLLARPQYFMQRDLLIDFLLSYEAGREEREDEHPAESR
jgi:hypothetical protein